MSLIDVNLLLHSTYAKIFGVPDLLNNENNLIPNGDDISPALWVCPHVIAIESKQRVCKVLCKETDRGCSKKTDTQFYFWDNFRNSAPILTILSLLQAEIYGA